MFYSTCEFIVPVWKPSKAYFFFFIFPHNSLSLSRKAHVPCISRSNPQCSRVRVQILTRGWT